MKTELINISELKEYENNAKKHPDEQIEQIMKSIEEFGFNDPIAIDENNMIIEGHGRLYAARRLGYKEVPIIRLTHLSDEQKRAYILVHNKLTMNTDFDIDYLEIELDKLSDSDIDMSLYGFEFEEDVETLFDKIKNNPLDSNLFDTFLIPPFSVLDTRQGVWQGRKRSWLDLGIASEIGRDDDLVFSKNLRSSSLKGTSVFDPVLCEISYLWFSPTNKGIIFDPFAGGSVRGIVAERLGFDYLGIDLRNEQIEANHQNATEVGCNLDRIKWICDDSQNLDSYVEDNSVDLLFTCPPYFDLEVYSEDNRDISNMDYDKFTEIYSDILKKSAKKLKDNRFAIVVISDVRDKKGFYRDLIGLTKKAFKSEGIKFYNDIILLNATGSGALRARRGMRNRKITRTHQNVLVFYKGDPTNIKKHFSELTTIDYDVFDEE